MGYFLKRFRMLMIEFLVIIVVIDFVLNFSFVEAAEFSFGFLTDPSLIVLVGFIQRHLDRLDHQLNF